MVAPECLFVCLHAWVITSDTRLSVCHLSQAAMGEGRDMYIDPATGYTVFTAGYLKQRPCCGNKCRHCPHAWENVAKGH
jgi:hypothetical protein